MPPHNLISISPAKTYSYLQNIQSVGVAEVPAPDLGAHVPAVEGVGGELYASTVEPHAGDGREGVPAEVQLFEPIVPVVKVVV